MSLVDIFKRRCNAIDSDPAVAAPRPVIFERKYNIHKRTLPVGIDKPILFGVSKSEGEFLIKTKFKPQFKGEVIVYFDLVPSDANKAELSVFFNSSQVTIDA